MVMHLACVNMRLSMDQALAAATINAAYALGRSHSHGSLEAGKEANLLIVDCPRYGPHKPLCFMLCYAIHSPHAIHPPHAIHLPHAVHPP